MDPKGRNDLTVAGIHVPTPLQQHAWVWTFTMHTGECQRWLQIFSCKVHSGRA